MHHRFQEPRLALPDKSPTERFFLPICACSRSYRLPKPTTCTLYCYSFQSTPIHRWWAPSESSLLGICQHCWSDRARCVRNNPTSSQTTVVTGLWYLASTTSSLCNPLLELDGYPKPGCSLTPHWIAIISLLTTTIEKSTPPFGNFYSSLLSAHLVLRSMLYQSYQTSKPVVYKGPHRHSHNPSTELRSCFSRFEPFLNAHLTSFGSNFNFSSVHI